MRSPKPLIVRAGLSRTFGSLAGFAALGLLSLGVYLLADAFAHPVDAEAASLIVAAFAIALAILLVFFLLSPQRTGKMSQHQAFETFSSRRTKVPSSPPSAMADRDDLRADLPNQRAYVDRSRVRP